MISRWGGGCLCCHREEEEEKVRTAEATRLTYLKDPCPEPVTEVIQRSIANCRHRASPKAHLSRAVKSFTADAGEENEINCELVRGNLSTPCHLPFLYMGNPAFATSREEKRDR